MGRSGALLATGFVLAYGTSCSRSETPAPTESRLVVHGREGTLKVGGQIPDGFPVSLMQGARATAVIEPRGSGSRERLVVLEFDGDILQAIHFYHADLAARGFTVEQIEGQEDEIPTTILRASRGADSIQIAVKRRSDGIRGTTIRVTWAETERP